MPGPTSPSPRVTATVLLVEDDLLAQAMYRDILTDSGYDVKAVSTAADMREETRKRPFDLMIVDMGLPDGHGLRAAETLARAGTPVIGITVDPSVEVRVEALERVAIDFLVKPVDERELLVRVRNALRAPPARRTRTIRFHSLTYHPHSGELETLDGQTIPLSTGDQELLYTLVMNNGRAVSREWLATELLGRSRDSDQRIIDVRISRLRKKLGPAGKRLIRTVRHFGYQLDAEIEAP